MSMFELLSVVLKLCRKWADTFARSFGSDGHKTEEKEKEKMMKSRKEIAAMIVCYRWSYLILYRWFYCR